jgi:mannitol-1-/sugar-/sorbitol-6-phosphatase
VTRRLPPLLFDLDGTLVDSSLVVERHWGVFARRHGLALDPILDACHGRRTADTIAEVAPWLDAEQEAAALDAGEENDFDGLRPLAGASDLLTALDRGRWAIVTSAHRSLAVRRLEAAGLPLPDVLVCGDEVGAGKPDPEGFLRAARFLAVAPAECIAVEDSPAGIEAGRRAGAYVIAITTTHRREDLATVADLVVDDLRELAAALAEMDEAVG